MPTDMLYILQEGGSAGRGQQDKLNTIKWGCQEMGQQARHLEVKGASHHWGNRRSISNASINKGTKSRVSVIG